MIMDPENTTSSELGHRCCDNQKSLDAQSDRGEIEFDGNTVLCRVCGDRASGFHYGVHACEGCKGFFRRSIQQKIQYRPCLKNQLCLITRINRNRCQYCRLKKCIAVGMSRDAVRFGRVPKREKAKILEQMQRVNDVQCRSTAIDSVLGSSSQLVNNIVHAHMATCEFTRTKVTLFKQTAWSRGEFVNCPAQMACPLNPAPDLLDCAQKWDQFTDCFMPAIRNIVNFAKFIPGFTLLSQEDQVMLLKIGTFEVLLVHLTSLFDSKTNTMLFTNGRIYKRSSLASNTGAGYLLDSLFDFSERFNELNLSDEEVALFSALILITSDRPGLRGVELVERIQSRLTDCLQTLLCVNHATDRSVFTKLILKLSELRLLNTVHSEKLLGLSLPLTCYPGPTMNHSVQRTEGPGFNSSSSSSPPNHVAGPAPFSPPNHIAGPASSAINITFKEEPKCNKSQINSHWKNEATKPRTFCNDPGFVRDELQSTRLRRNLSKNDRNEIQSGFVLNGCGRVNETGDFACWKESSNGRRNSTVPRTISAIQDKIWNRSPPDNVELGHRRSPVFRSINNCFSDTRPRAENEAKYSEAGSRQTLDESNNCSSTLRRSSFNTENNMSTNSSMSVFSPAIPILPFSRITSPPLHTSSNHLAPYAQITPPVHNGAAVVGHLMSRRVKPCELLLTTPLGSFHRTSSNMWMANSSDVEITTVKTGKYESRQHSETFGRLIDQQRDSPLRGSEYEGSEYGHQIERKVEDNTVKHVGENTEKLSSRLVENRLVGSTNIDDQIVRRTNFYVNNINRDGFLTEKLQVGVACRKLNVSLQAGFGSRLSPSQQPAASPQSIDSLPEMPKLIKIRRRKRSDDKHGQTKNKVMRTWCDADDSGGEDTGSDGRDCYKSGELSTSATAVTSQDDFHETSTSPSVHTPLTEDGSVNGTYSVGQTVRRRTFSVDRHLRNDQEEARTSDAGIDRQMPLQGASTQKWQFALEQPLGIVISRSPEDSQLKTHDNSVRCSPQQVVNCSFQDYSTINKAVQRSEELGSTYPALQHLENCVPVSLGENLSSSANGGSVSGKLIYDVRQKEEKQRSSPYNISPANHKVLIVEYAATNGETSNNRARSPKTSQLTTDLLRSGYKLDLESHGGHSDEGSRRATTVPNNLLMDQCLPPRRERKNSTDVVTVPLLNLDKIPGPVLYHHSFHPAAILYNHLALQLHAAQQQQQQQQQLLSPDNVVDPAKCESTEAEATINRNVDENTTNE